MAIPQPAPPKSMAKTADFDFHLPPELIAEQPVTPRDASRLMCLERATGRVTHRRFTDLVGQLAPNDLLLLNDTKVFPARIRGVKPRTGGGVELLLLAEDEPGVWHVMVRGKPKAGEALELAGGMSATVTADEGEGFYRVALPGDVQHHLERYGEMPLPPYLGRSADASDRERYQTVFARSSGESPGSVAAPTAGLHFTDDLLAELLEKGVHTAFVTLHVGPGTFLPVRSEALSGHTMHAEWYDIPAVTARAIARCKASGGRVIACGTTVTRAVETAADGKGGVRAGAGESRLFIYPGVDGRYDFRVVDGLITNFHLPKSTLLMLVCAFAGTERVLAAYREAVEKQYRFFSYGDAMLIT